jgi:hypothetical protein
MVRKLGELPKFFVFSSEIESVANGSFSLFPYCCSLLYIFQFLSFRGESFGVSNVFVAVLSDEHGQLSPLLPHRGWDTLFHGPALPGVPVSALRCTPPSRLRQESPYLLLPLVYEQ